MAKKLTNSEGYCGVSTISKMPFQTILRAVANTISLPLLVVRSTTVVQQTIDVQTARAVSLPPSPSADHDLEIGFGTGITYVTVGEAH